MLSITGNIERAGSSEKIQPQINANGNYSGTPLIYKTKTYDF